MTNDALDDLTQGIYLIQRAMLNLNLSPAKKVILQGPGDFVGLATYIARREGREREIACVKYPNFISVLGVEIALEHDQNKNIAATKSRTDDPESPISAA